MNCGAIYLPAGTQLNIIFTAYVRVNGSRLSLCNTEILLRTIIRVDPGFEITDTVCRFNQFVPHP